jgi:hypothetical protein
MLTGNPAFDEEWRQAQALTLADCRRVLSAAGMSRDALAYVMDMKGYPRIPYFAVLWVGDRARRIRLGSAVCMHAIGIKLLDDVLDGDQPFAVSDLMLGVLLIQVSTAELGGHDNAGEVLRQFERDYKVIWAHQLEEAKTPALSLRDWVRYARVKSGLMMADYAAVACIAAGHPDASQPARRFAEAVGVLFMAGDDLRDFRELGERDGNLGFLLDDGRVSADDADAELSRWMTVAGDATRTLPPHHDVLPALESFAVGLKAQARNIAHGSPRVQT